MEEIFSRFNSTTVGATVGFLFWVNPYFVGITRSLEWGFNYTRGLLPALTHFTVSAVMSGLRAIARHAFVSSQTDASILTRIQESATPHYPLHRSTVVM